MDRDGVVNRAFVRNGVPVSPQSLKEVEILPGVKKSILLLHQHGFDIVIVTNQPDVARGLVTRDSVTKINELLKLDLGINHFYTCFHDDLDNCSCRKPEPGLILKAAQDLAIDISRSSLVGDRWRDIAAGQKAGCKCFFIDYEYMERSPTPPFTQVSSLFEATRMILERQNDDIN